MKIRIISARLQDRRAEIVVESDDRFVTRHVRLESDGNYHWRGRNGAHEIYDIWGKAKKA